jgi:hypothetical protein
MKLLKNITASDVFITDTGTNIPALYTYVIYPNNYLLWAASNDAVTQINAGNLIGNDGFIDLSAALTIYMIQADVAIHEGFNNATNGFVATELQSAVKEARSKADKITYTSFTGNPKTATVIFTQPFPDANYGVTITGEDRRNWSIENQTANGFVINANANQPISASVFYVAAYKWS